MTIKELKEKFNNLPEDAEILVASDEELNEMFTKWDICNLSTDKKKLYAIFGFSGSESNFFEEIN
jgi:hypothetical protein